MDFHSIKWPAGMLGLLVSAYIDAAAIQLELFRDGKPVTGAEVLIDGDRVGTLSNRNIFWFDSVSSGRHRLEIVTQRETIPVNFDIDDDQVAFISVNSPASGAKPTSSVQMTALANVQLSKDDSGRVTAKIDPKSDDAKKFYGTVKGQIVSELDGKPVRNVRVVAVGADVESATDRFGTFELRMPAGVYRLHLTHPDYQSGSIVDLRVLSRMSVAVDARLQSIDAQRDYARPGNGAGIEEVLVVARYTADNPIALERMSASIVDNIDFSQIARFDDSSVSAAISRVVGVSLEDGRYAVVRGLKSRYQSAYLNGGILPSTDPSRRDLPLDIFPSSIMESLSLQKTATADVPGTATAGHINMRTKKVPDEPFFKVSSSVGANEGTDDDAVRTPGGDRDRWGVDDGTRDMPGEIRAIDNIYITGQDILTPEQNEAIAASVPLRYDVYQGNVDEDYTFDISGGRSWELSDSQRLGFLSAIRYSNKWSNDFKEQARYAKTAKRDDNDVPIPDPDNPGGFIPIFKPKNVGIIHDTDNTIDVSGLLNIQWDWEGEHQIGLNNLIVRHTINSVEQKRTDDVNVNSYNQSGNDSEIETNIEWTEEQVSSHQLWGEHTFTDLGELDLTWQFTDAHATYDKPDAIKYTYVSLEEGDSYAFEATNGTNNFFSWEEMEEDSQHYSLDLTQPFSFYNIDGEVKLGANSLSREREGFLDSYYFIMRSENIPGDVIENPNPNEILNYRNDDSERVYFVFTGGGVSPENDTGFVGGNYRVEQDVDATYLQTDLNLWEKLRLIAGVRREQMDISADMYAYNPEPLQSLIDEKRDLYSLGLTYFLNEQWQLRSSYTETVSWPEIFELLPRSFRDLTTLSVIRGNIDLEPADIKNYDLRLEWYPTATESLSFALFYKNLDNPIENAFATEGEDYDSYTFANVPGASVEGAEFDLRTEFNFGEDKGHEMFVQFNYAYIESSVDLPQDRAEADLERGLQGQPEYLINLQIGYDHIDTRQELTLVFNRKGPELFIVSPAKGDQLPNVYEQPYDDLRLVYKKHWDSGLALSLTLSNLLDSSRNYEYEGEGLPYLAYDPGQSAKLKFSYGF